MTNSATILIIEDDDLQYEIYEDALSNYNLVRVTNAPRLSPKSRKTRQMC